MLHDDLARFWKTGIYAPDYYKAPPPVIPREEPCQEPELIKDLRRVHESAHLVIGHILNLQTDYVNSQRGHARVEWTIPGGRDGTIGFLVALAASRAGEERFGATHDYYRQHMGDDHRKIVETARRVTASESDAQLLIASTYEAATALVAERWNDILWFRTVLERMGDSVEPEELPFLLRHIKVNVMRRRGFIPSDVYWMRHGLARPRGFDPKTREIDAVLSTGAAVRRQDWDGTFDEVLGMKPENVRLARLNQGAAVLDSHNWSGMSAVLGGIVPGSARLESGALIGRIKFSRGSALAQRLAQDLADGLQIPLSVGYKVHRSTTDRSTNPETRIATDWEPLEVSLVPISAEESGTGFRTAA
jgi:hypothetical protein